MTGYKFNDAIESFERINTLGIRLGSQEIESARVAEKHSGFIRNHLIPFLLRAKEQGF